MELLWFFLPMVFFLGLVTSYEDTRFGKIRNKWVALAIAYSFVALMILIMNLHFSGTPINFGYMQAYMINLSFSFLVGFFLWSAGLWSAGDGKLFIAFSAVIPLTVYNFVHFANFPSFDILVNSFVPFFAYFFAKVLIVTDTKKKLLCARKMLNPNEILMTVFSVLGLSSVISIAITLAGIENNFFLNLFILFVIYSAMEKVFGKRLTQAMIVLSLLMVFFRYDYILTLDFAYFFLIMLFPFILIRYFILTLAYDVFTRAVYIENLKPGMMPAEIVYKKGRKYLKREKIQLNILPELDKDGKRLFSLKCLTESDVKTLKKLHSTGRFKPHVLRVHRDIPFAPILFFGVILTFIFQGSFTAIFLF